MAKGPSQPFIALRLRKSIALTLTAASVCLPISAAQAKLNLGISSSNYLGQGAEGRQDSYSALDLQLDAKSAGDELDSRALVQSQIGFNDSTYRFVEFPELYVATSKRWTSPAQYTLGRKLITWSAADQTWGAGAFQPRFRWDYLRPQQVGLLGLYQEVESGPVKITAFYSPIFIPDRGAPLDFANGRIRSISPWAVNPPYETEVLRKTVPIRYDAKVPPIKEIIRQDTFAGQIAIGEREGPWGAVSYAYKPMNQLLMSYEAYLSNAATSEAYATIYPRVSHQHVASLDVGTRGKEFSGEISFVADVPTDSPEQEPIRIYQRVDNFFLVSPTLRANPWGNSKNGGMLSLSYLHVFGDDPSDTGQAPNGVPLVDGESSEFDSRYPFKSAFLFSAVFPSWRRMSAEMKVLLDLRHRGTIVSWLFSYAPNRDWRLHLATDVLSSFSSDAADGTDFIHRYRENDRVTGGVTYAF